MEQNAPQDTAHYFDLIYVFFKQILEFIMQQLQFRC